MKRKFGFLNWVVAALALTCSGSVASAQTVGTWTPLTHVAPENIGFALLLSDGTVMAQGYLDSTWYRLTPDIKGSYQNGTWTTLAPMHDTRLYFFSQVVRDGRVVLGGGEYGSGGTRSEYYDPTTNVWTSIPSPGVDWDDGNSEVLANGNVITAPVFGEPGTLVFSLVSNGWITGPPNLSGQDESAWVKLADGSILTIDPFGTSTERLIQSMNQWIRDTTVPVELYGVGGELGGAYLLPNGKAIFFGATSHTAIYTPSGSSNPGSWTQGPDMPNNLGQVDAPGAMMPNGKILLALGTTAGFGSTANFYEYDYLANSFTQVAVPGGGTVFDGPPFIETLLDLPDGSILQTGISNQLYVYQPVGPQVASGKPVVKSVTRNPDGSFHLTGTLFNGISEGAGYGDDWQMNTNFPIARLTDRLGNIQYARTYNWSNTGVQTGLQTVTTEMALPKTLPPSQYSLSIVANGIASDPVPFSNEISAYAVSLFQGVNGRGTLSDILKTDGICYTATSVESGGSQVATVEADFIFPAGPKPTSLTVDCSAAAVLGAYGFTYLYDWTAKQFVLLGEAPFLTPGQTTFLGSATVTASRFVGPGGEVRALVHGGLANHVSATPYTFKVDHIGLG